MLGGEEGGSGSSMYSESEFMVAALRQRPHTHGERSIDGSYESSSR